MDVYEAIEKRRTVRNIKKPLTEEQLKKYLLAGVKAPSGSNVQPWEFIVIDDPDTIAQIAELKYRQTMKMRIDQIVLDNPALIEQFYTQIGKPLSVKGISRQKDNYLTSTVVAVCNKKGHGIGRKPWMNIENIASTWMCIQNILLAVAADGLGAQISIFREEYKIAVEKILGIPEDCELTTMLLLGETEEEPDGKRNGLRADYSWLHRNKFGNRS